MLGAGLLGASGLWGAAGLGAAGLAGTGDEEDGPGGPSQTPRIKPSIDQTDPIVIGGDDAGPDDTPITITGTAEPHSTVVVQIGDETVTVETGEDGRWEAIFDGDNFPDDGDHEVTATVTEPDGEETDLVGPPEVIDTTPRNTRPGSRSPAPARPARLSRSRSKGSPIRRPATAAANGASPKWRMNCPRASMSPMCWSYRATSWATARN